MLCSINICTFISDPQCKLLGLPVIIIVQANKVIFLNHFASYSLLTSPQNPKLIIKLSIQPLWRQPFKIINKHCHYQPMLYSLCTTLKIKIYFLQYCAKVMQAIISDISLADTRNFAWNRTVVRQRSCKVFHATDTISRSCNLHEIYFDNCL